MKFTWFNLMPWPYLPDGFRETYRSVWVDLPNRLYDPVRGHTVYHEYMDQLEYMPTRWGSTGSASTSTTRMATA
jgi:hypothetical protein